MTMQPSAPEDPESRDSRREKLLQGIAQEQERLSRVDAEQADLQRRIGALKAELASLGAEPEIRVRVPRMAEGQVPRTPGEKVRLFRSLFRGREDLFPLRFVSKRDGKPGYAPQCMNKWKKGLCLLETKGKCRDCGHQVLRPVDDAAVVEHLSGREVMGVYPLLVDDTCWLLAVDFDKGTWADDVRAFAETCRLVGVPAAVERSRSGNGAHAWFYFTAPVAASAARKMGSYLLTETMSRRHELRMDSYDRLFPSQDSMPRGGYGNLIALPLQRESRLLGNSIFLDDQLQPIPDDQQWAYLASIARIAPATVELIARDATQRGCVVGVLKAEKDEDETAPWARLPSRKSKHAAVTGPLPPKVRVVLASKLFIEKAGLPSPLLNRIMRLAAFQNPVFYKNQSMRLSTATTPRVICCDGCSRSG